MVATFTPKILKQREDLGMLKRPPDSGNVKVVKLQRFGIRFSWVVNIVKVFWGIGSILRGGLPRENVTTLTFPESGGVFFAENVSETAGKILHFEKGPPESWNVKVVKAVTICLGERGHPRIIFDNLNIPWIAETTGNSRIPKNFQTQEVVTVVKVSRAYWAELPQ